MTLSCLISSEKQGTLQHLIKRESPTHMEREFVGFYVNTGWNKIVSYRPGTASFVSLSVEDWALI
jgi:hypothetical protein